MLKYLFSLLLLTSIHCFLFAQGEKTVITGIVKTADGKPAEFVNVSLKNTIYGASTDVNGAFKFEAPAGNYTMVVFSILAHRSEFPVTIEKGKENHFADISIIENQEQLGEVVVTGQFSPQSLRNSVYKVKIINNEQIKQKSPTNVQSLLNTEIGIRISNDMMLGETQFDIMGMGGNNIKILLDGVPMIDRSDNKQSLSQIDINTIERIEIVEGPMSVLYGSDALAGVINIITKKGKPGYKNQLSVSARVQEETLGDEYDFGKQKGQHIQSLSSRYTLANGLYAAANFSHTEFGGWKGNKTGRERLWDSKQSYFVGGQVGMTKNDYSLYYKIDYLDETDLNKGGIDLSNKAKDREFLAYRWTHQLQGQWRPNNRVSFNFAGSYQDYQRDKRNTMIDFSTGEKTPSQAEGDNDDTAYSAIFGRATGSWKMSDDLSFLGGLEFQQDKGEGDKLSKNNPKIDNAAVFVSAEYSPIETLNIRPGVRSSYNSKYDAPLAIPSLNLKWTIKPDMDIRLSYGHGFRAPTLQELYYKFYHVNGGGFWIHGNEDLKAEKSHSYMGSYTWRILHGNELRITSTLSFFLNNYKYRVRLIEVTEEDENGTTQTYQQYHNISKYKTQGLTLENNFVWKQLKANVSMSYLGRYNSLKDSEDYLDEKMDEMRYSPEVSTSISYDWSNVAVFNLFYKFTGARNEYKISNDELVLGGLKSYSWADLTISRKMLQYITISGGVKNIFDLTTLENTVSSPSQIGCGRSYFVGLSFDFN